MSVQQCRENHLIHSEALTTEITFCRARLQHVWLREFITVTKWFLSETISILQQLVYETQLESLALKRTVSQEITKCLRLIFRKTHIRALILLRRFIGLPTEAHTKLRRSRLAWAALTTNFLVFGRFLYRSSAGRKKTRTMISKQKE